MDNFSVTKSGDYLIITTNTFWSCNVLGNFRISKLNGVGSDSIKMSVPKELPYANGKVIFSYGDERCEYPSIDVFIINDCYIATEPMYNVCGEDNILKLVFDNVGEAISVKIFSNGIWTIASNPNSIGFSINGEELLLSAKEGTIEISPNIGCGNDTNVKIILKKRSD